MRKLLTLAISVLVISLFITNIITHQSSDECPDASEDDQSQSDPPQCALDPKHPSIKMALYMPALKSYLNAHTEDLLTQALEYPLQDIPLENDVNLTSIRIDNSSLTAQSLDITFEEDSAMIKIGHFDIKFSMFYRNEDSLSYVNSHFNSLTIKLLPRIEPSGALILFPIDCSFSIEYAQPLGSEDFMVLFEDFNSGKCNRDEVDAQIKTQILTNIYKFTHFIAGHYEPQTATGNGLKIDERFLGRPSLSPSKFEFELDGTVSPMGSDCQNKEVPQPVSLRAFEKESEKSFHMMISDYVVNSQLHTLAQMGSLDFNSSMILDKIGREELMIMEKLETFMPGLSRQLGEKAPGVLKCEVDRMRTPVILSKENDNLHGKAFGNCSLALDPSDDKLVLHLKGTIEFNGKIFVEYGNHLGYSFRDAQLTELEILSEKKDEWDRSIIMNGVNSILSKIERPMRYKVMIPALPFFQLKNLSAKYHDGYVELMGDIEFKKLEC